MFIFLFFFTVYIYRPMVTDGRPIIPATSHFKH